MAYAADQCACPAAMKSQHRCQLERTISVHPGQVCTLLSPLVMSPWNDIPLDDVVDLTNMPAFSHRPENSHGHAAADCDY
uniref:Uncharacterized protein n=1 Tax=Parascaris equorum TaxID=6256 RepID=A0A914S681_PAREQ